MNKEKYGCENRFNAGHLCEYKAKEKHARERFKPYNADKFSRIVAFIIQTPLTITRIKEKAFFL